MDAEEETDLPIEEDKATTLSLWSGVGMIVGMMIGSGIFASPGLVLQASGSVPWALFVWLFTGILSLFGALSYAELGVMMPQSGGEQTYLSRIYGRFVSFLFAWFSCTMGKPCSIAILLLVFAEYAVRAFDHSDYSSPYVVKATAIAGLLFLTVLNVLSARAGILFQNMSSVIKLVALLVVTLFALVTAFRFTSTDSMPKKLFGSGLHSASIGSIVSACYQGLWAYDGWNSLNFITGELERPEENLSKAIGLSLPAVVGMYLVVNVAYFLALPLQRIAESSDVAFQLFETYGSSWMAGLIAMGIAMSALGTANASIYTSARLLVAACEQRLLPFSTYFQHIDQSWRTPSRCLWLQAALVAIFLWSGSYRSLVMVYGWMVWIFYGLTVGGVLLLRYRSPERDWHRAYHVHWICPILFCLAAVVLVIVPIVNTPKDVAIGMVMLVVGSVVYAVIYVPAEVWQKRWQLCCQRKWREMWAAGSYEELHASDASLELS